MDKSVKWGEFLRIPKSKLAFFAFICLCSPELHAQEAGTLPPIPEGLIPDRQIRPPLPEYQPGDSPEPLLLPPVKPAPRDESRLSSGIRVFVSKIDLSGNTVFTREQLSSITAPYENRVISAEELQELRHKLTLHYVQNGYINSGALIPDQKVEQGIIRIHILEGKLTDIELTGNERLRSEYLTKRLLPDSEQILNIQKLQHRLQILQQSELIERINAELAPGNRLGEALLRTSVRERRPYKLAFQFSNNRSPSVGAERGEIYAAYLNFTGWGDAIGIRYGLTSGANDMGLFYSIPLTASNTSLSLSADQSDSSVVEEPFTAIDVDSELESYRVGVTQPFYITPWKTFSVGFALNRRYSKTSLLGRPFSFSPGVQNGESDVTVLRFSQDWLSRSLSQVIAARSTISMGIDALGATINASGPDGRFLAWLGQFQWAIRFGERNHQLILRTDLQLAQESLLPLEQCAIGGADTVRGYRVNQLVRDNCFVSSVEFRTPLFKLPIPGLSEGPDEGMVQLAPFADFGTAWNTDLPNPEPNTLPSVGVGLRWEPTPKIRAQLYWGHAFQEFFSVDHDLQDDGISFRIAVQIF